MKKQPCIAVGSSGSATGFGAVAALRKTWGLEGANILACDTNPQHLTAAARISDGFIHLPLACDPEFSRKAAKLLNENQVTHFIPIHDEEIRTSSENSSLFESYGIIICAAKAEAVRRATDKKSMSDTLMAAGVNAPKTVLLGQKIDVMEFPVFLKPRFGVGSQGVETIASAEELKSAVKRLQNNCEYVVQPWLAPPEFTIDAFYSARTDFAASACRERLETKAGICTKARVFHSSKYDDLTKKVAQALGLEGAFCFQIRSSVDTGTQLIIDVNPRIGGATAMSVAVGMDFPSAHLAYFFGTDPTKYFQIPNSQNFVLRSYCEHVVLED